MEFERLIRWLVKDDELKDAIDELLRRKREGQELDREPRIPVISEFIEAEFFSSSVTYLCSNDKNHIGWSIKRFGQRRGIAVFTNKRVIIKSSFCSPLTAIWIVVGFIMVIQWCTTRDLLSFIIALGCLGFLLQRRPFIKSIEYSKIESSTLRSVRGIAGRFPLLTIFMYDCVVNLVTADKLPLSLIEIMQIDIKETEQVSGVDQKDCG